MLDFTQSLLLVDKPLGITSFDVIRRLRRFYTVMHDEAKAPKMGHAGTLDPLATGLMLIGVGSGTKALANLIKLDKEYIAAVRIGEARTTGDLEGEVCAEKKVMETFSAEKVSIMLATLVGTTTLPVSAYSAIKKAGIPMYKRARKAAIKGEQVAADELPLRAMTVSAAELLTVTQSNGRAVLTVRFSVASGTYIRSLAEECGKRLGYPACLEALRRTKIGKYNVEDANRLPTNKD